MRPESSQSPLISSLPFKERLGRSDSEQQRTEELEFANLNRPVVGFEFACRALTEINIGGMFALAVVTFYAE
jgi:hypothetical protein